MHFEWNCRQCLNCQTAKVTHGLKIEANDLILAFVHVNGGGRVTGRGDGDQADGCLTCQCRLRNLKTGPVHPGLSGCTVMKLSQTLASGRLLNSTWGAG